MIFVLLFLNIYARPLGIHKTWEQRDFLDEWIADCSPTCVLKVHKLALGHWLWRFLWFPPKFAAEWGFFLWEKAVSANDESFAQLLSLSKWILKNDSLCPKVFFFFFSKAYKNSQETLSMMKLSRNSFHRRNAFFAPEVHFISKLWEKKNQKIVNGSKN